jgi:hypothetical protein
MPDFLRAFLGRIEEAGGEQWRPTSLTSLFAVALAALAVLVLANRGERWIPVLDSANLAFHEFGHPFFGLLSERLAVYGGTLGQLTFPMITMAAFWLRREGASFALCGIWLCENFLNISRYMADARQLALPLVGGKNPEDAHDWLEIFTRWGVLQQDARIAGFVTFLGWVGILAILAWLARRWRSDQAEGRTGER